MAEYDGTPYGGDIEMNDEDLINELFTFKKPLTSRYRKKYVEFLALGILQYCYGDTYIRFDVHDAPDISDENRLVGIEVTEAVTKEEAQRKIFITDCNCS